MKLRREQEKFALRQHVQEVGEALRKLYGLMDDMKAELQVEQQKFAQHQRVDELNQQVERLDSNVNELRLTASALVESTQKLMDTSAVSSTLEPMDVDLNAEVISEQQRAAHSQQVADLYDRVERLENILKPSIINAKIKDMMDMNTSLPAVSRLADVEVEEPPIQEEAKDSAEAS